MFVNHLSLSILKPTPSSQPFHTYLKLIFVKKSVFKTKLKNEAKKSRKEENKLVQI